jgi:hypothetical protein
MSVMRIVLVWMLLAVCMIANGILREVALVRILGADLSELASVALGIVIVLAVTRPFVHSTPALGTGELLRISILWLAMTVAFELSFGHTSTTRHGVSWRITRYGVGGCSFSCSSPWASLRSSGIGGKRRSLSGISILELWLLLRQQLQPGMPMPDTTATPMVRWQLTGKVRTKPA